MSIGALERHVRAVQNTEMGVEVLFGNCPECHEFLVALRSGTYRWQEDGGELVEENPTQILFPRTTNYLTHDAIPDEYKKVFNEAYSVLKVSSKASAALSRRLLQNIIRDSFGIKKKDLFEEIKELLNDKTIPEDIRDYVDAIRSIGNFAAHPMTFTSTGEIVDVEPEEAELSLEVLEALLDYKFVQPAKKGEKKKRLNDKLVQMGKSPILNA